MSATTPLPLSLFTALSADLCADGRDVALARRGDAAAFERLVRRYRNEVFNVAYGVLRHTEDAEDAVQEVLLRAHLGLARFEGRAAFRTWLLRIASNTSATILARQRAKKRSPEMLSLSGDLDAVTGTRSARSLRPRHTGGGASECPFYRAQERELHAAVSRAVAQLEPGQRTVFLLRVKHGESYRDIARRLGHPVGTIKSKLHRARAALRHGLRGYVGE